jgi:superfamily II DNA or RNA helicase
VNREEIQEIALNKAKENNYNGTIVMVPGSGKSKVAIECIKQGNFKNILITSPRTNLKKLWHDELEKWEFNHYGIIKYINKFDSYNIQIDNIQTVYKFTKELLQEFDFVIYDEIHTCGLEYYNLIQNCKELNIPCLGLTGTPTLSDPWKKEVLYKALPIIYEYYNAEEDNITNRIQYWVYEYELNDSFKVQVGTKTKKWLAGELIQYTYLSEQYEKAKKLMFEQCASNYFDQSLEWMNSKTATKEQKEAGRKFFFAVKARKDFLWNLTSSRQIALALKKRIIEPDWTVNQFDSTKVHPLKARNNKVLLFSELTVQAEKLSPYSIHSNNGNSAKECETMNKELLDKFNSGEIRELSSVNSLSLGLNMIGANYAVFESYSSSNTNAIQKCKRLVRLNKDDVANVIIIRPLNTQMGDNWFKEAFKGIDYRVITNLNDLKI